MTIRRRLGAWLSLRDTPIGLRAGHPRWAALAAGGVALALLAVDLGAMWSGLWDTSPRCARLLPAGIALAVLVALGARPRTLGLWGSLRPSLRFWWTAIASIGVAFGALLAAVLLIGRQLDLDLVTFPPGYRGNIDGERVWNSVVVSPLIEETIWRLAMLPGLTAAFGRRWAVLIDGAGFAALHFAYGNPAPDNFLGGYIFAWVYLRSGSIWLSLLLHGAANACVLVGHSVAWQLLNG